MTNQLSFIKKHEDAIRNSLVVILMIGATFALLTLQGLVHFNAPDFDKVKAAVSETFDAATMSASDEVSLRKNFGFNARDLEDFIYYAPKSAMDASEILIIKAKNEESLDGYRKVVEAKRSTKINTFKNYRPQQAEILEKSELKTQGNYLIFISSEQLAKIKDAVELSFR